MTDTAVTAAPSETAARSRRLPARLAIALAAIAAMFLLGACHYLGSGTVTSATGRGNAAFTFNLNCSSSQLQSGVLQYVDSRAGVNIRATASPGQPCVETPFPIPGSPVSISVETFTGTYVPLNGGLPGTFALTVIPGGSSIPYLNGYFELSLMGGADAGYGNDGTVAKGNITVIGS